MEFRGDECNRLSLRLRYRTNWDLIYLGNIFNEMQRLVNDGPESWLNAISVWKNLLELDAKKDKLCQRDANPLKRKVGENDVTNLKKLKTEQMQELQESRECQPEKQMEEERVEQGDFLMNREKSQEAFQNEVVKAADDPSQKDLTFRVSCRCSGAIAKTFTAQVCFPPRVKFHFLN